MKPRFIFLILLLVMGWLSIVVAQEPLYRQYAAGDWTSGSFVTAGIHPNGGYVILASANSWQQGTRTSLFRLDNQGDTLWTKAFWRHDLGDRWPIDMVAAKDGSGFYILMGNGIPTIQYNAVMKVDLQGDSLWQTVVSNNSDQWVNAPFNAIEALDNGGCVVAGNGYFFDNPPLVTTLEGDGDIQWMNAVSPAGAYSHYKKIRQSADGSLFAIGTHSSYDPGGNHSRLMISKFTEGGMLVWSRQFNAGTPNGGDMRLSEGHDVLPLADGGCIITGYITDPGITFQGQTLVKRLDENGNDVWTKTWFSSPNDLSTGFNLQPAGSDQFLLFLHRHASTAAGATLMKCTMTGDTVWTQWGFDYPIRMKQVQSNGQILMTGYIPSSPFGVFIRTSADGTYVPPGLHTPWNGQGNVLAPVLLGWNAGGAPQHTTQYDIQISPNPDFSFPVSTYQTNGTTSLEITGLSSLTTYYWRVRARGPAQGISLWSQPSQFTTGTITAIEDPTSAFNLLSIYPQPSSAQAWIQYDLAMPMPVSIRVTDATGRLLDQKDWDIRQPGQYNDRIETADWQEGVYLITFRVGLHTTTRTLIVQH